MFNGLPAGDLPASIFEIVLKGLTVRGSIVGTRQDLAEAPEFYARGQIHPTVSTCHLGDINDDLEQDCEDCGADAVLRQAHHRVQWRTHATEDGQT